MARQPAQQRWPEDPANTSSPTILSTGKRFTGDGGLIDLAGAGEHDGVGGDALTLSLDPHLAGLQGWRP